MNVDRWWWPLMADSQFRKLQTEYMSNYKSLDAWKNAMQLVKEVYQVTAKYPKEELFA